MRTIKASEFKAKCLAVLAEVEHSGQPVIITKHGRAVAELAPYRSSKKKKKKNARGLLKDSLFITGDIISPIDVEWDALK